MLTINGTSDDILKQLCAEHPGLRGVLDSARRIRHNKAIEEYQAAALYHFAQSAPSTSGECLEIGTARGYSASVIAQALPHHDLITLNPNTDEAVVARANLQAYDAQIDVGSIHSWDYLPDAGDYDLIFVDGDHKRVRLDLPYFNHLTVGGLMIFHDYSPDGSARPCQVVYDALNEMRDKLGRDFDVSVIDHAGVGMVGFARRAGEEYAP